MKKKIVSNLQLSKLKNTAMQLRSQFQLPYVLAYLIRNLSVDDDVAYVNSLKADTEHYLRIKGYYKKYPSIEKVYDAELRNKYKLD